MKKALIFVAALIVLSMITNARNQFGNPLLKKSGESGTCFDQGSHLINLGIGIGGMYHYRSLPGTGNVYKSTPAFNMSYEQAWPKKLGPGYLGIGAYAGFQTAHSRYSDYYYMGEKYYYEHRWNYIVLAARGAYHWDVLNRKNAEVYGGVITGLRITTYDYRTNITEPGAGSYRRSDAGVYPVASLFAGARWYFVPGIALFGEAGVGISYITGGITFKW